MITRLALLITVKKLLTPLLLTALWLGWANSLFAAVDLKVTVNTDSVVAGERIEYALTVTNTNSSAATNVVVQDLFSGDVSVDWTKIVDGGTCPGSSCQTGERITWDIGTLAANSSRTVRFEGLVPAAKPVDTIVSNLAELFVDTVLDSSVATEVVVVSPGLELSIVDDRDPVVPGDQVTYTLAFGNRSTNVLGVTLRAPLPVGTTFVSATGGGSVANGAVEWNLVNVLANTSGERQFTVLVDAGATAGDVVQVEAQLVNTATTQTLVRASDTTALVGATPVELFVTANPDPVVAGERIEYALTVTNTNTSAVAEVVVRNLIPEFVTVDWTKIPDGGTCVGSSCQAGEWITWDIGSLAANTSRTMRFEGTTSGSATAGTVLDNLATLVTDVGRATAKTAVAIGNGPGLELSIVDDRDPVVPGDQVTYTLAFGNRSTNVLDVTLRAPLPVGTTFVSATGGGSVANGAVEWNLVNVLANTSGERQFTVLVDAGATAGDVVQVEAQLVNTATTQTLVRASDTTALVGATPVELFVTANPDPVVAGERIEYALTITNTNAVPVTGVVVQNLIPEFVAVDWTKIPDGGTCPGSSCQAGERITWDIGSLAANTSRTVRFEGATLGSATAGTVLSNLATLVTDVGRATAKTAMVVGSGPGLELSIVDDRDPVVPGDQVTYTVVFGNRSASTVNDLILRAPVPVGTMFVSADSGGSVVNGAVQWALDTVLPGSVGERQFTVTVNAGEIAGGVVQVEAQLVNTATTQTLVRASDTTALVGATPVELFVTANPDPVVAGERIEYALTVTNTNAVPVTGVVVKNLFAASVTVNGSTLPDGGTCPGTSCQAGERITWDIGSLAANTSRTVRFEATVQNAAMAGMVLNNHATLVTDVGRATAKTAVAVGNGPGLELSMVDDRDPVVPGQLVTYTVVFGNRSASTVNDLILRAPVPAGTTFVSATAVGALKNGFVEWDLGDRMIAGGVDIRHFTVRVAGSAAAGDVVRGEARLVDSNTSRSLAHTSTVTALESASPTVRLSSTFTIDPVFPDQINYTLTVTNTSALPMTGVVVKDLFPAAVTVNGFTLPDGGTCPGTSCQAGERITWDVGTLDANTETVLHYQAVKPGTLNNGTLLRNHATLFHDVGVGSSDLDLGHGIVIDSDEDGLPDSWELSFFGNLNQSTAGDFDGDNLNNLNEFYAGTDPDDKDTENDGMPDGYEVANGFDPLSAADASQDADGDGLTNLQEFELGTKPRNKDSDSDGMPDKYEVDNGFNPLNPADAGADTDGDGFSNLQEFRAGTDPRDPQSVPQQVNIVPIITPLLLP